MLVTLDDKLQNVSVPVRVGKAVDTVGQAGRPKTITGFQTHTTPVLLGAGERAELATEECAQFSLFFLVADRDCLADVALSRILEGFVILKKNPDAV